jgi:hypothetical protein
MSIYSKSELENIEDKIIINILNENGLIYSTLSIM